MYFMWRAGEACTKPLCIKDLDWRTISKRAVEINGLSSGSTNRSESGSTDLLRASEAHLVNAARDALAALSDEAAELVCSEQLAVIQHRFSNAPFDGIAEEARLWADMASFAERCIYLKVIFDSLPAATRARFLAKAYCEAAKGAT